MGQVKRALMALTMDDMNAGLAIGRWNYTTKAYDPYPIDPTWKIRLYSEDMGEQINCTNCGGDMTYGEGFTSRELHNAVGLGYPVCESCYEIERKREMKEGQHAKTQA